jgi:hypothetical protein
VLTVGLLLDRARSTSAASVGSARGVHALAKALLAEGYDLNVQVCMCAIVGWPVAAYAADPDW